MAEHTLKTWPEFWDAVADGRKTFDVRKNDRGFNAGDTLVLLKFNPRDQGPRPYIGLGGERQGREFAAKLTCRVAYVLSGFGIEQGYVVMAIRIIEVDRA